MTKDSNPHLCLRVNVESGGCHGFQYLMSLTSTSKISPEEDTLFIAYEYADLLGEGGNPGWQSLAEGKPKVVMDEPSLELLKGTPHFPRDISTTYRANSTFRPLRPMERLTIYSMWHNNAYHWDMISGDERVFSSKVDTDLKFEFSRHGLETRNLASICDLRLVIQYRHKDSTGQLLASSLASLLNILGKTLTPGKVRLVYDFRHEGWTVQKVHEYLEPLIQLPGLASVAIVQDKFCSFGPEEVEAICTMYEDFGSRLVHQSKSHPLQPFPFLRLPVELQNTILAQTDVVSFAYHAQFERIPVSARQKFRKMEICLSSTRTAYVRSLPPDVASSEFGRQLSQKPNLLYPFLTWIREHLLVSKLRIQIYLVRNMWFLEGDLIELRDNVKKEGLEGCTEVVDIDEYELISIHWQ
ncbi:hypothetical protein EG328_006622 [Venturia inaequalis]|uniref:Uncharacterized protein n=1 Tax=Venturia inaequalis TaxID=5025 RepID=A0A8H3UFY9_VENIN|nr:hypothetical protein EG328_006622 [Venturia inaequalis]